MALPGRPSLARLLLLPLVLSAVPAATGVMAAAPAAAGPPAAAPRPVAAAAPRPDPFMPGRVLVKFRNAAGDRGRRAAVAAVDGRVAAGTGATRVVRLEAGSDVRAAARRLAGQPEVVLAEPDWVRQVDACDPSVCWQLQPRPGANVVAAHGHRRGQGRTVALVDTGVATGVADLAGRVAARWRCNPACTQLDPGRPDTAQDPQDPADPLLAAHGTEVASVLAANDDGAGTTGVAPEARIVSYRVDTPAGVPVSNLQSALLHIARDPDIDVVSVSISGAQWSGFERGAVEAVLAAGKAVVASAGNYANRIPQYPAAFPGVISVGATGADGRVAAFSSYGKVDLVAPGVCVAVAEVPGLAQATDCPGGQAGVAFASGTSFSAPIVAGLLALAPRTSPLLARLALEASSDPDNPAGAADAKRWAHGLADAGALLAAHGPGAPPSLVLETSGQAATGGHRFGSGDGQLPHPSTTFMAYAFQAGGPGLPEPPGDATFAGAAGGTEPLRPVEGEPAVYRATLDSGPLDPGLRRERATATLGGAEASASVPVLALEPDDQAPGVDLAGAGDDAWRRLDSVDGQDLDDVYAVTLERGDRLDLAVRHRSEHPVAVLLLKPGTVDVHGQGREQAVACAGASAGCPATGLRYQATTAGTYLVDVLATGPSGAYRLGWTVWNDAGPPATPVVEVPACSPNGDGVQERCAWDAGAPPGWTVRSFVTRGGSPVRRLGAGVQRWDGRDEAGAAAAPGPYKLRLLYRGPGGRVLLRAFALRLDLDPPRLSDPDAAPDPFEPQPADGDRDTTTLAVTSSEPGRLRVVIYRAASTTAIRVLVTGPQPAGRQRARWSGRTAAGEWLRGRFSAVLEVVDAAGNSASSPRHQLQAL